MRQRLRPNWVLGAVIFGATTAALAAAPVLAQDQSGIDRMVQQFKQVETRLGPAARFASSGWQSAFHFAHQWENFKASFPGALQPRSFTSHPLAAGPISFPDLSLSRLGGFNQSETSTAWCGTNAVVAFNDAHSGLTTFFIPESVFALGGPAPTQGFSFEGYSFSTNKGKSFTYKGNPSLSATPFTGTMGDPSVVCGDSSTFYLSTIFVDNTSGSDGVAVRKSNDGGQTWSAPTAIVLASSSTDFFDKPAMAIDASNTSRLYVAVTDAFENPTLCPGGDGKGTGFSIDLLVSTDAGSTWSSPIAVKTVCDESSPPAPAPEVTGAAVAVDPSSGKVYVAWEDFADLSTLAGFNSRQIEISSASPPVTSAQFAASETVVTAVHPVGDGGCLVGLQAAIRSNEFPKLAIGKGKANAGTVYVAWNDGDHPQPDNLAVCQTTFPGTYNFADIMLVSSTNQGVSWSAPIVVDRTGEAGTGAAPFTDQFNPAIATDRTGTVRVCWYDRRRDRNNFFIGRFCGSSAGGRPFSNQSVLPKPFQSTSSQDLVILDPVVGDYDDLTSDLTDANAGFVGGFAAAPAGFPQVFTDH